MAPSPRITNTSLRRHIRGHWIFPPFFSPLRSLRRLHAHSSDIFKAPFASFVRSFALVHRAGRFKGVFAFRPQIEIARYSCMVAPLARSLHVARATATDISKQNRSARETPDVRPTVQSSGTSKRLRPNRQTNGPLAMPKYYWKSKLEVGPSLTAAPIPIESALRRAASARPSHPGGRGRTDPSRQFAEI